MGKQTCPTCGEENTYNEGASVIWCEKCGRPYKIIVPSPKEQQENGAEDVTEKEDSRNKNDQSNWDKVLGSNTGQSNHTLILRVKSDGHTIRLEDKDCQDVLIFGRDAYDSNYLVEVKEGPNYFISKSHCEITFRNLKWFVRDRNSTNGTYLCHETEWHDLSVEGEMELQAGDILRLGKSFGRSVEYEVSFQ